MEKSTEWILDQSDWGFIEINDRSLKEFYFLFTSPIHLPNFNFMKMQEESSHFYYYFVWYDDMSVKPMSKIKILFNAC